MSYDAPNIRKPKIIDSPNVGDQPPQAETIRSARLFDLSIRDRNEFAFFNNAAFRLGVQSIDWNCHIEFMVVEAPRLGPCDGLRDVSCKARDFEYFFRGNRRRASRNDRMQERIYAVVVSFVLSPSAVVFKPRTAKAAQGPEVFQLKNAARGEHFDALFGKR